LCPAGQFSQFTQNTAPSCTECPIGQFNADVAFNSTAAIATFRADLATHNSTLAADDPFHSWESWRDAGNGAHGNLTDFFEYLEKRPYQHLKDGDFNGDLTYFEENLEGYHQLKNLHTSCQECELGEWTLGKAGQTECVVMTTQDVMNLQT
jgi:hypothetical protein